jgi:hypothetical protein
MPTINLIEWNPADPYPLGTTFVSKDSTYTSPLANPLLVDFDGTLEECRNKYRAILFEAIKKGDGWQRKAKSKYFSPNEVTPWERMKLELDAMVSKLYILGELNLSYLPGEYHQEVIKNCVLYLYKQKYGEEGVEGAK